VYRASLRFRSLLARQNDATDVAVVNPSEVEPEVARLVKNLLMEQLVVEVILLCRTALPFLSAYSKERVKALFIRGLSKDDDINE